MIYTIIVIALGAVAGFFTGWSELVLKDINETHI